MSNSQRTKGQNTALTVAIDSEPMVGSFKKVEGFTWKPLQEIQQSEFLGETESDFDIQHDGYEVTFTTNELDNYPAVKLLGAYVAALAVGDTLPTVTLVFIKSFRDPSVPVATHIFTNVVLKIDSQDAGDRKGFVKTTYSGKCKHMDVK